MSNERDPYRPVKVLSLDSPFAYPGPDGNPVHVGPLIETTVPACHVQDLCFAGRAKLLDARDWPDSKTLPHASFIVKPGERDAAKVTREQRERHRAAAAA